MSEFKGITGPGKYRTRNGDIVTITHRDEDFTQYPWRKNNDFGCGYTDAGEFQVGHESPVDIIAGPLPDDAELAGLTGYAGVYDYRGDGKPTSVIGTWIESENVPDRYEGSCKLLSVVALSTIRKDQLVRPEPKRETRKVWVNLYPKEGQYSVWPSREKADSVAADNRIACVKVEITFTHGEGL